MHIATLAEDLQGCLDRAVPGAEADGLAAAVRSLVCGADRASDADLVRLGAQLGLDLHQGLTLVLKSQWEGFRAARGQREGSEGVLLGPGPFAGDAARRARYLSREFHPGAGGRADGEKLFRLFEGEEGWAGRSGYDAEAFQALVHQCILLDLHLLSIHGPEVRSFATAQDAERELMAGVVPAEREAYWLQHRHWREMENEVGALLLEVETQALENARVEQQWLEVFGPAYLPLLEAEARVASLERMIARKREAPDLTREDLDSLEAEQLRKEDAERARLARHLARGGAGAALAAAAGPGGMPWGDEDLLGYEEDCKRVLREIYRLTHPDAVSREGFTEIQRERLTGYYREAVACAGELDDREVTLGMRSLEALEAILGSVRKIWACVGLDVNEGAVIRGDTLGERMAWLEGRIGELREEAARVRSDFLALATDPDVREKRASMASRELMARITQELEARRAEHAEQIPELEAELRRLLGEPDPKDDPEEAL